MRCAGAVTRPISTMRPPSIATSAVRAGAPVPSHTVPPRRTRSITRKLYATPRVEINAGRAARVTRGRVVAVAIVARADRTVRLLPLRPHSPLEERHAHGRMLRKHIGRALLGRWKPARERADPVETILRAEHGRMAVSPFGFFRGAVAIMAADLATLPTTGLGVQICGDAHVRNLGAFAAPDGHLVFDVDDFDETARGPWEWDLKRLATSFVLAGRESGMRDRACVDAVGDLGRWYR